MVRENRGSPEAGDHDTAHRGVITHENGLSGAGMGRHEGTWAWGDVEKLGSAIVPGSAKRATWCIYNPYVNEREGVYRGEAGEA